MQSAINLIRTDRHFVIPSAPDGSVTLSSVHAGWKGITLEQHCLEAMELPEHHVIGHQISVHTGSPVTLNYQSDGRTKSTFLTPGDVCLVSHNGLSFPRWTEHFEFVKLAIMPEFVTQVLQDTHHPESISFVEQRGLNDPQIERIALLLRDELLGSASSGAMFAESLATALILHLYARYSVANTPLSDPRGTLSRQSMRQVTDYIETHLDQNLELKTLAELVSLSPYHFSRLFKASLGSPPYRYVMSRRLVRARNLLKFSTKSVGEIARECGFFDQSHFGKQFLREFLMTPHQFALDQRDTSKSSPDGLLKIPQESTKTSQELPKQSFRDRG